MGSFRNVLALALLGLCLAILAVDQSGVIDYEDDNQEAGYLMESPEDADAAYSSDSSVITLKDGVIGAPYRENILYYLLMREQDGLTCPCTYTVDSMTIPGGLSLSGSAGLLSGIPKHAGTWTFDVCIEDSAGYGVCTYDFNPPVEFSITIHPELPAPVSLTGNYEGDFEFTDNVGNPLFKDAGTLELRLVSVGAELSGYYTFSDIEVTQFHSFSQIQLESTMADFSKPFTGTINGEYFDFSDGWISFSGDLVSGNKLVLNFESCYLDGCCVNPEHVGESGDITPIDAEGIPDVPAPVYSCESGIIGSATLTKV